MNFRNRIQYDGSAIGQNNQGDHPFDELAVKVMGRSVEDLHQGVFHEFRRPKDEMKPAMPVSRIAEKIKEAKEFFRLFL